MRLVLYFLRLGSIGFGGPIALVGEMHRSLVVERKWIDEPTYLDGLAFSQMAPGPLAAQLAIYLGFIRAGILGATLVALVFILPSFLIVLGLSMLYVNYGGLEWMQAVFYGVGAAVIALISRSAWKLLHISAGRDKLLVAIFSVHAVVTVLTEREMVLLFFAAGAISLLRTRLPLNTRLLGAIILPAAWPALPPVWELLLFFAKASLFVFGSGLAIVPFLYGGVVQDHHWLTERQFLDAIAVAMITPGPVVITVAFIGYIVAGPVGATMSALGVFLPVYASVVLLAPLYSRYANNLHVKAFVAGVTAAAAGAIAGAVVVLARRSIIDVTTLVIFLLCSIAMIKWKLPDPLVIAAAAGAGVAFRGP